MYIHDEIRDHLLIKTYDEVFSKYRKQLNNWHRIRSNGILSRGSPHPIPAKNVIILRQRPFTIQDTKRWQFYPTYATVTSLPYVSCRKNEEFFDRAVYRLWQGYFRYGLVDDYPYNTVTILALLNSVKERIEMYCNQKSKTSGNKEHLIDAWNLLMIIWRIMTRDNPMEDSRIHQLKVYTPTIYLLKYDLRQEKNKQQTVKMTHYTNLRSIPQWYTSFMTKLNLFIQFPLTTMDYTMILGKLLIGEYILPMHDNPYLATISRDATSQVSVIKNLK